MSITIEGTWRSHYEYGRGEKNEPQTSEHTVEFVQKGETWIGTSLPNENGSELTITLRQHGDELRGEWRERTSPTGEYQGRKFSGLILLLPQAGGAGLSGMWLGASSSTAQVKAGVWRFDKMEAQ